MYAVRVRQVIGKPHGSRNGSNALTKVGKIYGGGGQFVQVNWTLKYVSESVILYLKAVNLSQYAIYHIDEQTQDI